MTAITSITIHIDLNGRREIDPDDTIWELDFANVDLAPNLTIRDITIFGRRVYNNGRTTKNAQPIIGLIKAPRAAREAVEGLIETTPYDVTLLRQA